MLGYALLGALLAGTYGVVHDQVTYSISAEYFTRLKFSQFQRADFGFPPRVFVAEIGFLAPGSSPGSRFPHSRPPSHFGTRLAASRLFLRAHWLRPPSGTCSGSCMVPTIRLGGALDPRCKSAMCLPLCASPTFTTPLILAPSWV